MSWANNNNPSEFGTQSCWPDGTVITSGRNVAGNVASGPTAIKDLWPQTPDVTLIGRVLTKQDPRVIKNKNNPGADRSVLSFTLRDSPIDFINISCWGRTFFIDDLAKKFKIGDIVKLQNPQIMPKSNTEIDERYKPWTPSHFQLSFSEKYSSLQLYSSWDASKYVDLAHVPVQDSKDFHTLGEILSNGQNLHQQHVNIFALVKNIGQAKDISTKAGRQVKRIELKLLDETCPSMALIMWDEPIISYAQQHWVERETVIFVVDVLAKFDDFRRTMVLTADSKTIFTTNPDTKEAYSLFEYGKSVDFDDGPVDNFAPTVNLSTIKDVYNVGQLQTKLSDISCQVEYGLMYVFLSSFNIDGSNVTTYRCSSCRFRILQETGMCSNPSCSASGDNAAAEPILTFDLRVNLSDHTGTVTKINMNEKLLQELLGCSAEEFVQLPEFRRTELKWSYLLERCKVYFKVVPSGFNGANNSLRLLACQEADPKDVCNNFSLA